jgi:ribosomal protein S3
VRPTAKRWHRPGSKILGIGFAFSGRVYGAQKAASFKMLLGSVPFNTLDARIDYANIMQQTRNGT